MYEDSDLHVFNGMTTRPWGYVELTVLVHSGKDVREVKFQFLVVPCISVYSCILRRPFVVMLDMLDSHVHLKYYNLHGQSTTINVDLEGAKRIC